MFFYVDYLVRFNIDFHSTATLIATILSVVFEYEGDSTLMMESI